MKKLWKKNKGAAMISVLIAMTFIMLLASSLLYVTYINYKVKTTRYFSTDNFYTAEFALADLTSAMQQVGADAPSGTSGKQHVYDTIKDGSNWDPAALEGLITVASQEATITIDDPTGNYAIVNNGTNLTLKSVRINATPLNPQLSDYESHIVTDITLSWPESPKDSFSIYDFSIITDAEIDVQAESFTIGGCLYCKSILVEKGSACTLTSPMAAINGNLTVEDGAVLAVTGKTYVVGDITVEDGGTLINTGELYYAGGFSGEVRGISPELLGGGNLDERRIFALRMGDLAGEDGLATSMVDYDVPILKSGNQTTPDEVRPLSGGNSFYTYNNYGVLGSNSGVDVYVGVPDDTLNGITNSLVITEQDAIIQNECSGCTFISPNKIRLVIKRGGTNTFMSRMTESSYNAALDVLYHNTAGSGISWQPSSGSGKFSDYVDADGNILDSNVSVITSRDFTVGGGKTVTRTYYKYNGANLLPVSSIISADAGYKINELCNIISGDEPQPEDSIVTYQNWYKE